MNITEQIKQKQQEIADLKANAAAEQAKADTALKGKLEALMGKAGYTDAVAFVKDVSRVLGANSGRKVATRVTPEMKEGIRTAFASGDKVTNEQVAEKFNISVPTLATIKRELGLVRAKKTAPATV